MTSFIFKAVIISVISFVYKLYKNIKLTIFDILNNNSIITVIKKFNYIFHRCTMASNKINKLSYKLILVSIIVNIFHSIFINLKAEPVFFITECDSAKNISILPEILIIAFKKLYHITIACIHNIAPKHMT